MQRRDNCCRHPQARWIPWTISHHDQWRDFLVVSTNEVINPVSYEARLLRLVCLVCKQVAATVQVLVDFKSSCNDKRTFEKIENLTGTIVVTVKWRRGRTTPEGMIVAACLLCVQTGCSNRAGGEEARLIW